MPISPNREYGLTRPYSKCRTRLVLRHYPNLHLDSRSRFSSVRLSVLHVQFVQLEFTDDKIDIAVATTHDRRHEDSQHVAEHSIYLYLPRCQIQRVSSTLSGQARPGG